ncbi:endoribonuclease Dicer [Harmonia axyridis]|uniref:endoribonuclease Dicer n=1 Tax=Harmonia axyridis TaxID=115357 RepID=UPI001E279B00|nr:endoribonuclease Dicer [Harmonia axyridis]
MCTLEENDMETEGELIPRNYQEAIYQECLKDNTIIFLPTGAGKTFIAIMVLKNMGGDLLGNQHKVSIILVNTVALVDQHVRYIKKHTPFQCGGYSGEMNVDFWSFEMWTKEFQSNQVLVMTSEILAGIVRGNMVDMANVNLLIFDECHHAVNDHSMRILMKYFSGLTNPPRVLGLTATLLNRNCKTHKVMEEVRELEKTFNSKIATVEGLDLVVGYATNPKEFRPIFTPPTASEVELSCLDLLDYQMSVMEVLNFITKKKVQNTDLNNLEPSDGGRKVLVNLMKDVKIHLDMFGIYGGIIGMYVGNITLQRYLFNCSDANYRYAIKAIMSCLGECINRLKFAMKDCADEKERIFTFSSDKVLKLFEILRKFKESSEEELCGLIFVERRSTAKVLHHVLKALSENDPNFNYIKSDFIVGANNVASLSLENLYVAKKNKEVINRFTNKETNLLCTSQVLEEGIDIPKCSMVCKFDVPKDYRSYIQSKGRARHKKSHYYILVPRNELQKFGEKYREYQVIEQTLNEYLIGKNDEREKPSQEEIDEMYSNDLLKPFYVDGPGSACIDPVSSISLLSRYCQTLQCNRYTQYAPEWYYKIEQKGVVVTVCLPTVCPLRDEVKGVAMRNKRMAKRAAAYEACIKLYFLGELNEFLLPKPRVLLETDVSHLFEHHPKHKEIDAGLKKMRLHDLEYPEAISGKIEDGQNVYLHIMNFEPLFTIMEDETKFYNTNLTYGFITPNLLPDTCSSPIFVKSGTIVVSILNNVKTITLSKAQVAAVKQFHFVIFNDVLNVLNNCFMLDHSDEAESLFLVPARKDTLDIDYEVLEKNTEMVCQECIDDTDKSNLVVDSDNFLHKIVYPPYRIDFPNYLVLAVCENMNPHSAFPNETYKDFFEYYDKKYSTKIIVESQPLLSVRSLSKSMNLYRPVGLEKKRKWDENFSRDNKEYLIPEMCGKREFPAELWIQGRFIPCVLYRLIFMLRVESLWQKIGRECGFKMKEQDMKPLKLNLNLIKYKPFLDENSKEKIVVKRYEESERVEALPTPLMGTSEDSITLDVLDESRYPWKDLDEPKDIERMLDVTTLDVFAYCKFISSTITHEQRKVVFSPKKFPALTYVKEYEYKNIEMLFLPNSGIVELADMYEAMTTPKANDIVNLERLETLGDSFLKFITSQYISVRFPHFDEGRATLLKGRIISNKNLYYLAEKHNMGGIMRNKDLRLKNGWIPPGFCIPEKIRLDICDKVVSWKILNSFNFTTEEMISGDLRMEEFTVEVNEYNEDVTEDSFNDTDHYLRKQFIKDKCVADAVEAILGTYLLNTGIDGCLKVVQWMGIIPPSEKIHELLLPPVPSAKLRPEVTLDEIKHHLPLYQDIETILGYTFKDKSFLLQAFTHASYTPNRVTLSYEKLEFLGDAVLDFLITCFIFENFDDLTPGDLTDLRSALVNNNTFASFIVRLGLHKYLLLLNSKLQYHIDKFVDFFSVKKNFVIDDEVLILLEEEDLKLAEYVDVPKVLGDLFEALAAAIYMDSGYCLQTVWKVFYRIMWKEINLFSSNIPKNAVRMLHEKDGTYPEFDKAKETGDGSVMVRLNFLAEGRPKYVYGFGSNKTLAKKAAAKIALRNLQ